MPRDASSTREKIMAAAQGEIMRRGFAATSVDVIQEAAGISRGTFFYHFPTKNDLARALLDRYAQSDREIVDGFMQRAERLAGNPLQQLFIFLMLHEEMFDDLDDPDPGCLFASYSYEAGLFDDETHAVIEASVHHWRQVVGGKLREIARLHPPRRQMDPDTTADLAYGILQGAFILSRVEQNPGLMSLHLRQLRGYLELLFGVEEAGAASGENAHAASDEDAGTPSSDEADTRAGETVAG